MVLHNLHVLILKKNGVKNSDATGDGTGYSLTVKKNYESYAQRRDDRIDGALFCTGVWHNMFNMGRS